MEENIIKETSPWLSIWIRPRETVRKILDNGSSTRMVLLLAALGEIVGALDQAASGNAGNKFSLGWILILCVVLGAIGGIVGLYINSVLLLWTGKWIGGQGSFDEIKTAIAWANIPTIWSSLILILEILLLGNDLFKGESAKIESNILLMLALLFISLLKITTVIWGLIVYLKCLGEAQKFSALKAFSNLILSYLVIIIPVGVIAAIALTLLAR